MVKKLSLYLLVAIGLFAGSGCSRTVNQDKFLEYVNNPDKGLLHEREINGVQLNIAYKPTALVAHNELWHNDSLTETDIHSTLERYAPYHYFQVSISQGGKEILSHASDKQKFGMLVNQFAFGMGEDAFLITAEQDTLPLVDFIYPRYFGMAPSTDILFAFKREENPTEQLRFELGDFGMSTGSTRYKFDTKDINKSNSIRISYKKR